MFYALKILLKPALIKDQFCVRLVVPNEAQNCNHSTMHQSKDSIKCISKHRLMDTVHDYPFDDDETFNQSCLLNDIHNLFTCSTDAKECFALLTVFDGKKDCADGEDENEKTNEYKFVTDINFQMIYDDVEELSPFEGYEEICKIATFPDIPLCIMDSSYLTEVQNFLGNIDKSIPRLHASLYFTLRNMPNYPLQIMKDSASSASFDTRNQLAESDPFLEMNYKRAWLCN